jgi:hypothetical protein
MLRVIIQCDTGFQRLENGAKVTGDKPAPGMLREGEQRSVAQSPSS